MSAIIKPVTSFVKGFFGLGKQKLNKIKPMDISAQTSNDKSDNYTRYSYEKCDLYSG